MTTIVDEDHCATDSSSDDSYEHLKELESSLYSIIHYNNLSEIDASHLPEGYKIVLNESTNDIVVSLQDAQCDFILHPDGENNTPDLQYIEVASDKEESTFKNLPSKEAVTNIDKTSVVVSSKSPSPNQSLKSNSDVEVVNVRDIECINLIDTSDSEIDVVEDDENQASKTNDVIINTLLPLKPSSDEVIMCSSSEDENIRHEIIKQNSSTNKRKREKSKLKKNNNAVLKSQCPKKWTASMVKYYTKISSKRLHFDSAKLIKKMRGTVGPSKWALCNREFDVRQSKVRCLRCKQHGHLARHCSEPFKSCVCHMCGESGHREKQCRQSRCLTCGDPKQMFIQTCKRCNLAISRGNYHCSICKSNLHNDDYCPDLWRGFHLTTNEKSALIIPLRSTKLQRFCSNCNRSGHLEYECREFTNSIYVLENPDVSNYFAVAQAYNTGNEFSVILKLDEDEDSAALFSEKGCDFLQNLSNSTQARIELDDDPKVILTVFGSMSQCRAVKESVVSYLEESGRTSECVSFHKHKKKSILWKKRKTL